MDKKQELDKIVKQADDLAARYWQLGASDRGQIYSKWIKCMKKAKIFHKNES